MLVLMPPLGDLKRLQNRYNSGRLRKTGTFKTIQRQAMQWTAAMLLASTLCGLLSPAAAAMSRDSMASVADTAGLSSDVKDFFVDVLEGGMLTAASVVQVFSTSHRVRSNGRVLFVLSGSADFDSEVQTSDLSPESFLSPPGNQIADCPIGNSAVQPLGP